MSHPDFEIIIRDQKGRVMNRFFLCARAAVVAAAVLLCISGVVPNQKPDQESDQTAGRTKVAAGEYVVVEQSNGGAVGPFGEEIYNFDETWTLWHTPNGQYEIEGERRFESPRDSKRTSPFRATLSRDFTLLHITELERLRWLPDAGPLNCDFRPRELFCSASAREPLTLRTPMQHPYALLWPISAFSLSGLTREVERDPDRASPVQFVVIEQPSPGMPVQTTVLAGELRYLGQEKLVAAGETWPAFKFSFAPVMYPRFLIWTSAKGLLLALAVEHEHINWPQEGIRLVHIEKSPDF
jgi:hypothetical protein